MDVRRYYILLALARGPMHGVGIHEQIQSDSRSTVYLRHSSLYYLLGRLEKAHLIEGAGEAPGFGGMRKLYRLTETGYRILKAEAHALEEVGRLGLQRLPY